MIRHSLNYFLWRLARESPRRFDNDIIVAAIQYLNSEDNDFHRRLRTGFRSNIPSDLTGQGQKNLQICMITSGLWLCIISKCKFFGTSVSEIVQNKPFARNELIMIPVPKPKFFERKVPVGQSEDDYFDEITARQTHVLEDAIDRVSFINSITTDVNDCFVKNLF